MHTHKHNTHTHTHQELNSKAEGKFNRLKTQAKTKISALNKELEGLRVEGGAPQLNLSAQVSSSPPPLTHSGLKCTQYCC